jgi:transcriptional regulator with XRE-family HTH domain
MTVIDLRPTFGDYVRKARKTAGLSQAQVAEALGTSQARVSRWENGDDYPSVKEYHQFVEITGVAVDLAELVYTCSAIRAGQAA